jgi:conjugal transfer ATP-binding protein TraC
MKYQVREGRNRVVILVLSALGVLVFILAIGNGITKVTLLQEAKAFTTYLNANPDQFSEMETQVIRGFQPAVDTGFSSVMISCGATSSFHRVFVDPVTRAMFSTRGEDYQYMSDAQDAGATSEEAAYMLACEPHMYQAEMQELERWAGLTPH